MIHITTSQPVAQSVTCEEVQYYSPCQGGVKIINNFVWNMYFNPYITAVFHSFITGRKAMFKKLSKLKT